MAHAQKPDLVFQRNGRVHLNQRGCQFSRLLAVEECGSADSDCIDRAPTYSARLLATHAIRIFPLHFPSRASPCAIRFQTRYTTRSSSINLHAPSYHSVFSVQLNIVTFLRPQCEFVHRNFHEKLRNCDLKVWSCGNLRQRQKFDADSWQPLHVSRPLRFLERCENLFIVLNLRGTVPRQTARRQHNQI